MTQALRYAKQSGNTSEKLECILSTINDANIKQVILFATPIAPTSDHSDSDGLATNLPEVAALAIGTFAGAELTAVFDGTFLSAARYPRYSEVKTLLDVAVTSGKAYFSTTRAPFTSNKSAVDAATAFQSLAPYVKLTATSRSQYFDMLSNLTEAEMQTL
jgi:hypothetical protein